MAASPFRRRKAGKTMRNLAIAEAALALARDRAEARSGRRSGRGGGGRLLLLGGAVTAAGAAAYFGRDKIAGMLPSRTEDFAPTAPTPPQPPVYEAPAPVADTAPPIPAPAPVIDPVREPVIDSVPEPVIDPVPEPVIDSVPEPVDEPPAALDVVPETDAAAAESAAGAGTPPEDAGLEADETLEAGPETFLPPAAETPDGGISGSPVAGAEDPLAEDDEDPDGPATWSGRSVEP